MLGPLLDADRVEGDGDASRFAVVVNLFDNNLYQADLVAERHRFPDWIEGGHHGLDILLGKQVVTDLLDVAQQTRVGLRCTRCTIETHHAWVEYPARGCSFLLPSKFFSVRHRRCLRHDFWGLR